MEPNQPGDVSIVEVVAEHLSKNETQLPLFDATASRVQSMIQNREFDVDAVAQLVESDPALSGPLLRLANSSFFGGIEKVVTVRDAIMRLGIKQVAELVILSSQKKQYKLRDPAMHDLVERLWKHAVAVGIGADWLVKKLRLDEIQPQAFLAGLMHDVGKLLLLRVLDDLKAGGRLPFEPSTALVGQLLDGLHAEQGYALMQQWNIPEVYAEIVRDHEEEECQERNLLLCVVRLVDRACNKMGIGLRGDQEIAVAESEEARVLRVSEVALAELEIKLEDALDLAQ